MKEGSLSNVREGVVFVKTMIGILTNRYDKLTDDKRKVLLEVAYTYMQSLELTVMRENDKFLPACRDFLHSLDDTTYWPGAKEVLEAEYMN